MAKVKGFNPPETEFAYEDADGLLHYFGEFLRMVFGEGSVSPRDPDTDFIGKTRRGRRPTEQGEGTPDQIRYREAFKNCATLWNSLPEECPDPLPDPPPTSKESVWGAKTEHGVTCSYYDLFLKCCIDWAISHDGAMPVGDCFPCEVVCTQDPAMAWDYDTSINEVNRGGAGLVAITGLNAPFTWSVSGVGFSLAHETTEGVTNTLDADDTACGSAMVTVTGCDDRSASGYVRCSTGQWVEKATTCQMGGRQGSLINSGSNWYLVEAIEGNKKQTEKRTYTGSRNLSGCEDIVGTCAQFASAECAGVPCLSCGGRCAAMGPWLPYDCGGHDCRNECYRYWSGSNECWWVTLSVSQFGDGGATWQYFEWEC